jgi:hypothetical protein
MIIYVPHIRSFVENVQLYARFHCLFNVAGLLCNEEQRTKKSLKNVHMTEEKREYSENLSFNFSQIME